MFRLPLVYVFILALGVPLLATETSPSSQRNPFRRACSSAFAFLHQRFVGPVGNLIAPPPNPLSMNAAEYMELRGRTVGSYFSPNRDKQEAKTEFLRDFAKVIFNFSRMYLNPRGELRAGSQVESLLSQNRDFIFRNGFVEANRDVTIENLLLREILQADRPPDLQHPTVFGQLARFGRTVGVTLPLNVARGASRAIWDWTKWGVRQSTATALIGSLLGIVLTPISNRIDRTTNDNFGWIGVSISNYLSSNDLQNMVNNMQNSTDRLHDLNERIAVGEVTVEEGRRLQRELERTFLEYRRVFNSTLPADTFTGRSYYRDGNIFYPIVFATAAMAANTEINTHEGVIRQLETLQALRDLTPEQQRSLEYHRAQIPISQQRLTTALVAWRVNEIIFPEFSRADFMQRPDTLPIMRSYETFRDNFRMEDYAREFEGEMRRQLQQLNILIQEENRIQQNRAHPNPSKR